MAVADACHRRWSGMRRNGGLANQGRDKAGAVAGNGKQPGKHGLTLGAHNLRASSVALVTAFNAWRMPLVA
jgi:hypothetical protein